MNKYKTKNKIGRPKIADPKCERHVLRMTEKDHSELRELSSKMSISMSEVLRIGIYLVKDKYNEGGKKNAKLCDQ